MESSLYDQIKSGLNESDMNFKGSKSSRKKTTRHDRHSYDLYSSNEINWHLHHDKDNQSFNSINKVADCQQNYPADSNNQFYSKLNTDR